MKIKKVLIALFMSLAIGLSSCDFLDSTIYSINFESKSYSMVVGEEQTVLPVITSSKGDNFDKTCTWISENPLVATVENGTVTPIAEGKTRITAKLNKNQNYSDFYTLTVERFSEYDRIQSMSINKKSVTLDLNVKDKDIIQAYIEGDGFIKQDINWTSSNEDVVSVQNGAIEAHATGTAKIKASSALKPTCFAECIVNVIDSTPGHLVIDPSSLVLDLYGNKSAVLYAKYDGVNSQATWRFKDNKTTNEFLSLSSYTSYAKVTAKKVGQVEVIAMLKSTPEITASCVISIQDTTPEVTSISLVSNAVTLDLNSNKTEQISVTVEGINNPMNTVTWSNSNNKVCSIDNDGTITALSIGSATLTATSTVTTSKKASCVVTVIDTAPVSVELNATEKEVPVGKTCQLVATVKHTLNNEVTYSSNSTDVSVSNTGLVSVSASARVGLQATITARSVEDTNATASCVITVTEKPVYDYDYTIMYYMCASNLEYDSSGDSPYLFTQDIKEIISTKNMPTNVKILVETGGTKAWKSNPNFLEGATSISASKLQRWEVNNATNKLKLVETLSTNKMSTESSFQSFLEWGLNNYNAEQMGVVISGHGGGVDGCAYDDNNSSSPLSNVNVYNASKNALAKYDREKFTWIGYDCCLMDVADIASINADNYDYMVAAEESENGTGWDHDIYLAELKKNPSITPENFLPYITSSFVSENHSDGCGSYYYGGYYYCYQTLAALNLKNMNTFVDLINKYVSDIGGGSTAYNVIKQGFNKCYRNFGEGTYGLVDFGQLLDAMHTVKSSVSVAEIKTALNNIMVSNSYCSYYKTKLGFTPTGLTAFVPESYSTYYSFSVTKTDYTEASTKLTAWRKVCYDYGSWR